VWWKDLVLIREPGNPSYTLNTRHWYRNATGQNVSSLNGVPPGISAEYQSHLPPWYYDCQNGLWEQNGDQCLNFTAYGLNRLGTSITLTRMWVWQSDTQLVMEESISGAGKYRFSTNLHLGDAPWKWDGKSVFTCSNEDSYVKMRINYPQNTVIQVVPANYAPEYGVEEPGRTIRIAGSVNLPLRWVVEWNFYL
jgi:hypothetical protein